MILPDYRREGVWQSYADGTLAAGMVFLTGQTKRHESEGKESVGHVGCGSCDSRVGPPLENVITDVGPFQRNDDCVETGAALVAYPMK
jgi:hypothetical protein